MKCSFYEGSAFTDLGDLLTKEEAAPGNPAVICLTPNMLSEATMQEIAMVTRSPMTTFLAPNHIGKADYDIRYLSPNGTRVDLCGHATLVATKSIMDKKNGNDVSFQLDPIFYPEGRVITGQQIQNQPQIIFPRQESNQQDVVPISLLSALELTREDIQGFRISNLNDHILILKNVEKLRSLRPNFQHLINLCNASIPHRTIVVTAQSSEEGLDFEARVFAPAIGVNEDIACGSANCSVGPMWQEILGKNNLRMAYPSLLTTTFNKIGGYQSLNLHSSEIVISANVRKLWEMQFVVDSEENLLEEVKSNLALKTRKVISTLFLPLGNGLISSRI